MTAKKSAFEQRSEELDKHFRDRRDAGLPAHRPQEHSADVNGVSVRSLAGVVYVSAEDVELDQEGVFTLIKELQATFQAVS